MSNAPKTVEKRLKAAVPRFQKILISAQQKDINEADTVVIITDMLEEVFGMDKYEDVTREFSTGGTFIDLAIKTNNKIDYLIEVKAIGISLKPTHLRQAVQYAATEGVNWAVLTNGIEWEIHRVVVDGTVTHELILAFNFLSLNTRSNTDLDILFLLCKRAINKDIIEDYYQQKEACNKFTIGAILISEDIIRATRRVLRKMNPNIKVSEDEIKEIIFHDVLKREVSESEQGKSAVKALTKSLRKSIKKKKSKDRVIGAMNFDEM